MATKLDDDGHVRPVTRTEAVRELRGALARGDHWIVTGTAAEAGALARLARIPRATALIDRNEPEDPLQGEPVLARYGASTVTMAPKMLEMEMHSFDQTWVVAVPKDSSLGEADMAAAGIDVSGSDVVHLGETPGMLGAGLEGRR